MCKINRKTKITQAKGDILNMPHNTFRVCFNGINVKDVIMAHFRLVKVEMFCFFLIVPYLCLSDLKNTIYFHTGFQYTLCYIVLSLTKSPIATLIDS